MTAAVDLLGRGWAFPVRPSPSSRLLGYTAAADKVRAAIWLILSTAPGERVMRPDFGAGLRQFLMQPNSVATRALIEREVRAALDRWEPRITVRAVTVSPSDDGDPAQVLIEVRYVHRLDARPDLLVYPFSLEAAR